MQSALFIGRFQPFHKGHLDVVKKILKDNERIIIVIGSAEKNFMQRDPLTAGERFQLIEESLKEAKIKPERYCIIPVRNVNNYALWVNHINIHVPPYTKIYTGSELVKACYLGKYYKKHEKNKTGPKLIDVNREIPISASEVRESILRNDSWEKLVPKAVAGLFKKWDIKSRLQILKNAPDVTWLNDHY